jgi:DnaK suppressor protein
MPKAKQAPQTVAPLAGEARPHGTVGGGARQSAPAKKAGAATPARAAGAAYHKAATGDGAGRGAQGLSKSGPLPAKASRGGAKAAVHEPAKAAVHEPAKAAVHEPAKAAVHEPAKAAVHEPSRAAAHETARAPATSSTCAAAPKEPAAGAKGQVAVAAAPAPAGPKAPRKGAETKDKGPEAKEKPSAHTGRETRRSSGSAHPKSEASAGRRTPVDAKAEAKAEAKAAAGSHAPTTESAPAQPAEAEGHVAKTATGHPGHKGAATAAATAAPEEVIDQLFLRHQRELLMAERNNYTRQAEELRREAEALALEHEPGDVQFDEEGGEGGTANVDRELDLHLSQQAQAAVEEIDAALAKIGAGTYGFCENCGIAIPRARLEALPHARLCVACKSGGLAARRQ